MERCQRISTIWYVPSSLKKCTSTAISINNIFAEEISGNGIPNSSESYTQNNSANLKEQLISFTEKQNSTYYDEGGYLMPTEHIYEAEPFLTETAIASGDVKDKLPVHKRINKNNSKSFKRKMKDNLVFICVMLVIFTFTIMSIYSIFLYLHL